MVPVVVTEHLYQEGREKEDPKYCPVVPLWRLAEDSCCPYYVALCDPGVVSKLAHRQALPRTTSVRYGAWPPRVLPLKMFYPNSVTWVELSKFNVHIVCCFLLSLRIHDFLPVLGRKRVNHVCVNLVNSRPRNRLAGVLPVVGCLVDRHVSKKLPIRCWSDSFLPLQVFVWLLKYWTISSAKPLLAYDRELLVCV